MKNDFRYEIKFVLNEREMSHALTWLSIIGTKKFSDRSINSLYFDNLNQELARDNLAGISNRCKVRLRYYGDEILESSVQNLEVKLREGRLGSKIIYSLLTIKEALKYKALHELSKDIFQEIYNSYFTHTSINNYLIPILFVKYKREYYKIYNEVRITIDRNIKFYNTPLNAKLDSLKPIFYNSCIMEIKFPKNLKFDVANLIRSLHITPKRHSKYLTGLAKLGYASYI